MAASTSDGHAWHVMRGLLAALAAVLVLSAEAMAGEWRVHTIDLSAQPERLSVKGRGTRIGHVRILTTEGGWLTLSKCGEALCARDVSGNRPEPFVPKGAIPDAEVATGKRGVLAAWLAAPTKRYAHGVLGDAIEAGALVAMNAAKRRYRLELAPDSVFEDRLVRLADLDGDGTDELIAVRAYLDRGAALAVMKLSRLGVEIKAETPAIGIPNRWLNPAGIADYDGDGRPEIAIVVTPHIGGTLEFWEYRNGRMVREMQLKGFSNHAIGSRVQEMSATADFDGDGIADLALPDNSRSIIRIISLAGGQAAEIKRIRMPGEIVTEILALKLKGATRPVLLAGLATGKLAIASWK